MLCILFPCGSREGLNQSAEHPSQRALATTSYSSGLERLFPPVCTPNVLYLRERGPEPV